MDEMEKQEFYYSNKYEDEDYEYRHVSIPKSLVMHVPRNRLMYENEWRKLGVTQSRGWVHYLHHKPEPNILLFRRPLGS